MSKTCGRGGKSGSYFIIFHIFCHFKVLYYFITIDQDGLLNDTKRAKAYKAIKFIARK